MSDSVFPLAEIFKTEFEYQINKLKQYVNHGPSLGRYVEILTLELLRKYFPKIYDFSSGFYYSQNPERNLKSSTQMDIICFDRIHYPLLFDDNETVVVTPKSVKGLIEIKSTLNKNAVEQLLLQSNSDVAKELSLNVKFNLLATKSSISPETVCKHIINKYEDSEIVRGLGCIYSLDWKDIIVFHASENEYKALILNNFNYGVSSFINQLIMQMYGKDVYLSIANQIGPSLFIPKEVYKIR